MKNIFSNPEKGVSLIITFFIMAIVLAVVVSVSVILYSEIKIIRSAGNSVGAFYSADSGVEKILYYDRKMIPEGAGGGKRGVCGICGLCLEDNPGDYSNCNSCELVDTDPSETDGCDPLECKNCEIRFDTNLDSESGKSYKVFAKVFPEQKFSNLKIESSGSFKLSFETGSTDRSIEVTFQKDESRNLKPEIIVDDPDGGGISYIEFITQPVGSEVDVVIHARVDAHGNGVKRVIALVYNDDGYDSGEIELSGSGSDGYYTNEVSGLEESAYYADITAWDMFDNQSDPTIIMGTVPN